VNQTSPPSLAAALVALLGLTATCGLDQYEVAPPGSPAWDVADASGDAVTPDADSDVVAPDASGDADDEDETGEVPLGDGGDEAPLPDGSCPDGATFCFDRCVNLAISREHCGRCGVTCGTHGDCINAACVCDADYTFCPAGCVKLASDRNNCGACGVVCATGEACRSGVCG
jgi:hypothetical protein